MQINRLFEIIYTLMDRKTVTAKELAEHFEVSTRTIYRDIDSLSAAGIPVYMSKGRGGGVSILEDFVLNKAVLTSNEKREILSSLQALSTVSSTENDSAIKKLSSLFGESNPEWIEIDFSSWYNADKEQELFDALKSAIITKKVIAIDYSSSKGEGTCREVEPLKICFKGMARYLYGFCLLRNDYRFFKLSRIKNLQVSDKRFTRETPAKVFDNKISFCDEFIKLKLKISPEMSFRVYDEFDEYEKLKDGSFIVEISYPKGEWVFYYIASFGQNCEVLEPQEIRDAIKEEFEKTLKNYL